MAKLSIGYSGCEARASVSIRQFHVEYQENHCHAIQASTDKNPIKHYLKRGAITNSTYDLQVLQITDAGRQKFKVIVAQVQSPKGF